MKEDNIKSQEKSNKDLKEDEKYKNLPEFIKSMIENLYNSSSQKSSNSNEKNNNSSINNNKNKSQNKNINYDEISKFQSSNYNYNIYNNYNTLNNENIKVYNIKDSNLSIMKNSLRIRSILSDNYNNYMNNIKECSICFRVIINYGLLSNCDDVFCYECIKLWRNEAKSKNKREMFRRCPICNSESPLLIKSKFYLIGEEKRQKMIEYRKEINNN
jgi:hypothetical protein